MPDIQKTRELQYKVMQDIAAGALIPMMRIGDELRLFEKLYKFGPCSSDNFSIKIKMDKRYIREWLLALSAASYIKYNPASEDFSCGLVAGRGKSCPRFGSNRQRLRRPRPRPRRLEDHP